MLRLFECVGDDDGDVLSEVVDRAVGEGDEADFIEVCRLAGLHLLLLRRLRRIQFRRVEMREHRKHAGRFLRVARIDRADRSCRDRARHERGVRDVLKILFVCILRGAGDFRAAVDAIERLADIGNHAAPPARSLSARTSVRFASSIL